MPSSRSTAARKPRVPKYCEHKRTGHARVIINGQQHWLGRYGTPESLKKYQRLIAGIGDSAAAIEPTILDQDADLTVVELVAEYVEWASGYYVKNGELTGHIHQVRRAARALREAHSELPIREFSPNKLRALQESLVHRNLARSYINDLCGEVRRMFKWAASRELVPVGVYQALLTVDGLKRGRTQAREHAPILPVDAEVVDATLPFLPEVVADMVRFQRLTGCRPAEVCILRPRDVDAAGETWRYTPNSHKTEHHGRGRCISIGPRAQALLRPYLLRDHETFCFAPAESERRNQQRREGRLSPLTPSQNARRPNLDRTRPAGARYTSNSYRRCVVRAVARANKQRRRESDDAATLLTWHPNQLRHTAATKIRRDYGLEAAQVVLGHSYADVTQTYAERDQALADRVMREVG